MLQTVSNSYADVNNFYHSSLELLTHARHLLNVNELTCKWKWELLISISLSKFSSY